MNMTGVYIVLGGNIELLLEISSFMVKGFDRQPFSFTDPGTPRWLFSLAFGCKCNPMNIINNTLTLGLHSPPTERITEVKQCSHPPKSNGWNKQKSNICISIVARQIYLYGHRYSLFFLTSLHTSKVVTYDFPTLILRILYLLFGHHCHSLATSHHCYC